MEKEFDTLEDLLAYLKSGIGIRIGKKRDQVKEVDLMNDLGRQIVVIRFRNKCDDLGFKVAMNPLNQKCILQVDQEHQEKFRYFCEKIEKRWHKEKAENAGATKFFF